MRLGLIGSTGHWQTYAPALDRVPGLSLVAVAASGSDETLGAFDHAPGLSMETCRYENARKMLDSERLDAVQVSCRGDIQPRWILACLERGLPVVAEKPLAMDRPTLESLFHAAQKSKASLIPMHTMRGVPELAAIRRSVREGTIGEPLLSFSQKSYKWGKVRPDFYRSRQTFPGLAPWVGIHAFDWLYATLGDVFTEVIGREGAGARPDFPACASQAAFALTMRNGGVASVTLDYLRPESAPTHGDERLRIAGLGGVIETALSEHRVLITAEGSPPRPVDLPVQTDLFTEFARSLQGEGLAPLSLREACRITEIALRAQEAADTGAVISLQESIFRAN